jgi:hypothetical protein
MKVVLFMTGLMAVVIPGAALACKCSEPALAQAVAESKYVYIGTVMRGRLVKGGELSEIESTVLAHRIGKGDIAAGKRIVRTGTNSCSTPLAVGQTYAVFESEEGYVNAMCTGTELIHRTKEDEFIQKVKEVTNEG